jgi:probable phosphoglycerate mutase
MGELILIRHGETAWSRSGQHAGRTDLPMTDAGVAAARALAPALARRHLVAAFSSPLSRAMRTAELAGLVDVKPDPDLLEWDYGGYEGMTEAQIQKTGPGWPCGATASCPASPGIPASSFTRWPRARTLCSTGSGRC